MESPGTVPHSPAAQELISPAARPSLTRIPTLFVLARSCPGARDACASLGPAGVPRGPPYPRATQGRLSRCPVSPSPRIHNLEGVQKEGRRLPALQKGLQSGGSRGARDVPVPCFLNLGCVGVYSLFCACRCGDAFRWAQATFVRACVHRTVSRG